MAALRKNSNAVCIGNCKYHNKQGSLMVEAALIIPLIMMLAVFIINTSLGYYKDVCAQVEKHQINRFQIFDKGAINNQECEFARRADLFIE